MQFIERGNSLVLKIDNEEEKKELLNYFNEGSLSLDESMYEFFEPILANSHFRWICPEEIGALTDAPILGYEDENGNTKEAYGFMDYCVSSILEELFQYEDVTLQKG